MFVTDEVFQDPIGWLNTAALANIISMFVTDEVSHAFISSLKLLFLEKRMAMFVIPDVHQVPISPNAVKSLILPLSL